MLNMIIFGAPGSGKGTQSAMITKQFNLLHLSTGDLLRNEIANNTQLGIEAEHIIAKGKLVSDEIVIGMINNKINATQNINGFLFDGFPRTLNQANALDNLLKQKKQRINLTLVLEVSKNEIIKRLLERGKTSGRADDVNEIVINKRLDEYKNYKDTISTHYQKQNCLVNIQGEGNIETIFAHIVEAITKIEK